MKFEDFKQLVIDRGKDYAGSMKKFYECPVSFKWESMTAGPHVVLRGTFDPNYGDKEVFVYIFDNEAGCFVKGRLTKKGLTVNKTQPKTPITLDNFELNSNGLGVKGIHAANKGSFTVVRYTGVE